MALLADTDSFCKLGVSDLLEPAVEVLGGTLAQCERLQALPHMLQRGKLSKRYGPERCEKLLSLAAKCPVIEESSTADLDRFTGISDVDPGEAMLFARASVGDCLLMTGDKRALRAVAGNSALAAPLAGKIVLLESLIASMCEKLGIEEVHRRLRAIAEFDTIAKVLVASPAAELVSNAASYAGHAAREFSTLHIWEAKP